MVTLGIIEEKDTIKNSLTDFCNQSDIFPNIYEYENNKHFNIIINNTSKSVTMPDCLFYMFNSDEKSEATLKDDTLVISYGLNSIATVTASSIYDEFEHLTFQYCLQRGIVSFSGKKIEPMEFPVKIRNKKMDIHSALAIVTTMLIFNF